MILDFATAPEETLSTRYDVCVAGAGPAGQVIARRLAEAGKRVLLLEGGGLEVSEESQELYEGDVLGMPYFDLAWSRLRYFGGATNHWGGRCRPLDSYDFDRRDDIPLSGWPITADAIEPYLLETCDILGLGPFEPRLRAVEGSDTLTESLFRWSLEAPFAQLFDGSPVRFESVWRDWFEDAEGATVLINANLTGVRLDPDRGLLRALEVQGYQGRRAEVTADSFVLAMGGLENVRFLLNQNRRHDDRLGNQGGMVGLCWMEHPHIDIGKYIITERVFTHLHTFALMLDSLHRRQKAEMMLSPTPEFMRQAGIMNCGLRMRRPERRALSEDEIGGSDFMSRLVYDEDYFYCGNLYGAWEQAPNPESKLVLIDDVDRFGARRAGLDWRLQDIDLRTPRACVEELGRMLIRTGLGRARVHDWMLEPTPTEIDDFPDLVGGKHHMGGARMSETPATGVVDADCRIHGIENAYVAGSAIYPTAGHANPTVTIVQFALRLADHLKTV